MTFACVRAWSHWRTLLIERTGVSIMHTMDTQLVTNAMKFQFPQSQRFEKLPRPSIRLEPTHSEPLTLRDFSA
jgi:hypothetical protein